METGEQHLNPFSEKKDNLGNLNPNRIPDIHKQKQVLIKG